MCFFKPSCLCGNYLERSFLMLGYQVEIKQLVDYPRCRVHREFIQTLIADRSIRTNNGCSGLFYYAVLCSYANFRTSYRRIDGITYTI